MNFGLVYQNMTVFLPKCEAYLSDSSDLENFVIVFFVGIINDARQLHI
jgi:hypothetical protein